MLAWIDLETTGLDYTTCGILEVALVITDNDLTEVHAESHVLHYHGDPAGMGVDPYVIAMHTKNGLWAECAAGDKKDKSLVEADLLAAMRRFTEPRTVPMCGSTIAFDRMFLRRNMPALEKHFHYRNVDVSTVGELAARWYPEKWDKRPKGDAHRALTDIRQSVELARYWRREVFR